MQSKRPKRILIISHDASLYGATLSLLAILEHLKVYCKAELLVFIPVEGLLTEKLSALDIAFKVIPFRRNAGASTEKRQGWKRWLKIAVSYWSVTEHLNKAAKPFKPEIIYTNTSVIYWGMLMCLFSPRKHVWHFRELQKQYDIHHESGFAFFRFLVSRSSSVICNSKAVAIEYGIDNKAGVKVIHNGVVAKTDMKVLKRNGWSPGTEMRFGMAGAIHPSKGQLEVVKALTGCECLNGYPYTLQIAGDPVDAAYFNELKAFIKEQPNAQQIQFAGYCRDMDAFYDSIDVLIVGSLSEAFGRVIPEAMARGVLVIARNTGGVPEIVDHKRNGLLFNDEAELKDCLCMIVNNSIDSELLRHHAFETVKERFTTERYVNAVTKVLLG